MIKLTAAQIDTMPAGCEMDVFVAEVMGLDITDYAPIGFRKDGLILPIPSYSTEMAAAWDVATKLNMKLDLTPSGVYAYVPNIPTSEVFSHSGPLSIARAALKSVRA